MEEDKLSKAIDLLISEVKIYDQYYCLATSQALKTVLNELDRLQKDNEELRKFILEGVTIEKSPYQNYRLDFLRENFIPIKEIKEKFKKINETKIDLNKINARDYMIFGETETATGWFINIDYIEKILLDVPGYEIESKLKSR